MEVHKVLFLALVDPLCLEPVLWSRRVVVKPPLGTGNRTACRRLVDKRLRHQRHFVEQRPCQRHALDQVLGAFVLPSEDIEVIHNVPALDGDQVVRPVVFHLVAAPCQHQFQSRQHVPPERPDGLPTQCGILAVKRLHRPQHERQRQADRLPGTDGSVADNAVAVLVPCCLPPAEHLPLALGKRLELERVTLPAAHRPHPPSLPLHSPSVRQ